MPVNNFSYNSIIYFLEFSTLIIYSFIFIYCYFERFVIYYNYFSSFKYWYWYLLVVVVTDVTGIGDDMSIGFVFGFCFNGRVWEIGTVVFEGSDWGKGFVIVTYSYFYYFFYYCFYYAGFYYLCNTKFAKAFSINKGCCYTLLLLLLLLTLTLLLLTLSSPFLFIFSLFSAYYFFFYSYILINSFCSLLSLFYLSYLLNS